MAAQTIDIADDVSGDAGFTGNIAVSRSRLRIADGIQALRHYRYEMDEKLGSLRKVPLHDWASHPADAYRTAAVAIREPEQKKEQEKRRSVSRLSPWS